MKSVSNKINFPELESRILEFWRQENIFRKSVEERPADNEFIFYDGPPFATGLPHYGHLLAGTIKDVIPRYKTMQGYRVERRFKHHQVSDATKGKPKADVLACVVPSLPVS